MNYDLLLPLAALALPEHRPGDRPDRAAGDPLVRRSAISSASCSAGGMPSGWSPTAALWPDGAAPMKPDDLDDFLVWAALGIVARRPHRLRAVLRSAALSRQPARHRRGLAGRHVVPWRLPRHDARDDPVRPRARHPGLDAVRRRRRRRAGRRSAWCASPISSIPSCGAGSPTCPGRSNSPMAARCRAIRASSTKPCLEGWSCSSCCASSPTASAS